MSPLTPLCAAALRQLWRDRSGLAVTETALVLPFFLGAGLCGVELANYSLETMRVGQLAVSIADNASRIGDTSTLENRKIYESDINDLLLGASIEAAQGMGLFEHGRVIVSSLEVNANGNQYIHWQRCMGKLAASSNYGNQGDVLTNGMGPSEREVIALTGEAVIFVELQYDYQPLVSDALIGTPRISTVASFTVRSSRDLTQIYQADSDKPDPIYTCNLFIDAFA
ncbi:pilus assembly protein [Novosphingobium sp. 1949]|uniref:Pilus assembly protein n=1 Tax=Novosphingobium organovorum TaxID=2930092 RepID=A0ABT0B8V8_9SPHN|nr:TadE/TadG family type IV pilus assembly protein [Novosphingobium organovorum]MCJ2181433.1 pilus assembly protein [Novosphingobium organovorum]